MGFVLATGQCLTCKALFSFNPLKVPSSTALTGEREPICKRCIEYINLRRIDKGLEPFPILAGAYDAADESELPE